MIQNQKIKSQLIPLLLVVPLFLIGCGGGGGGGGGGSSLGSTIAPSQAVANQNQFKRLASSIPKKGSVTQSSRLGAGGISRDEVEVVISGPSAITRSGESVTSAPKYELHYNGLKIVDTANTASIESIHLKKGDDGSGASIPSFVPNSKGVDVAKRGLTEGVDGITGDFATRIVTDYDADNDTDYLTGGFWFVRAENPQGGYEIELGAFADGSNEYEGALPVSGSATYAGGSYGLYSTEVSIVAAGGTAIARNIAGINGEFYGSVKLTATFSPTSASVAGGVDGVRYHDFDSTSTVGFKAENSIKFVLNPGAVDKGFFTGNVTYETTETNITITEQIGKWGGQFYGTNDGTGPSKIAGTFGGVGTAEEKDGTTNSAIYFGSFFTYKE